jgi:hypothetical protein
MPDHYVVLPTDKAGDKIHTRQRTIGSNTIEETYGLLQDERVVSCQGRCCTFRIPGRAGTTGQKIFAIHNATGSSVLVDVRRVQVDVMSTATKAAITNEPPLVRLQTFTTLPTNGSAATAVPMDTTRTSNASVTLWQDAAADRTSSGTALTITPVNTLAQEYAARELVTAVGQDASDNILFAPPYPFAWTLRALQGLVVFLDYNATTANPTSDFWVVMCEWYEYTLP